MRHVLLVDLGTGNTRVALADSAGAIWDMRTYTNSYYRDDAYEDAQYFLPAEWEERIGRDALAVFRAVGLSVYARADFIVKEDGTPCFLEINTLPGMTPTSLVPQEAAAVGISYGQLCQTILEASLRAREEER